MTRTSRDFRFWPLPDTSLCAAHVRFLVGQGDMARKLGLTVSVNISLGPKPAQ